MDEDFAKDPYKEHTCQSDVKIRQTIDFLCSYITANQEEEMSPNVQQKVEILDVGGKSPMTEAIEHTYRIWLHSTIGDLDDAFGIVDAFGKLRAFDSYNKYFDYIIYSHTIEHQFNPLLTLNSLRCIMKKNGTMFIFVPCRGKLLWTKNHYHEIDTWRMGELLKQADMEIIRTRLWKVYRPWWQYFSFKGILRLFFEYNKVYVVKRKW